jgi:hypothetical protein
MHLWNIGILVILAQTVEKLLRGMGIVMVILYDALTL